MEPNKATIPFLITYKDGSESVVDAEKPEDLIRSNFSDREHFKKKVALLSWKEKSTLCVYHPDSNSVERRISDADVNPYSWRIPHS
jgi:hypothetical protein